MGFGDYCVNKNEFIGANLCYLKMPKNIDNVVTDVQEKVTADHFPVKGSVCETIDGWTIVEFTTPNQDILRFEVHLEHQNSCVLETRGFTFDQRDTIIEIFTQMMFD